MSRSCQAVLALAALLACGSADAEKTMTPKDGSGVLISGAAGLPDLARGQRAAADGRTADAERDLLPLAESGYVEAQYALAKLYGRMETPEKTAKAILWYRRVLARKPEVQAPLARLLLREPTTPAAREEAEGLLRTAWTQREEIDALAGLIRAYTEFPELDRDHRFGGYIARAEQLDRAETNVALIHWYRATPRIADHPARLLALCHRSLDLAPACYVDLAVAARAAGDRARVRTLGAAVLSQFRGGRLTPNTAASFAHAMLADADGALPEAAAATVSDLPEDDNPGGIAAPAAGAQICGEAPVGVALPAAAVAQAPAAAPPSKTTAPDPSSNAEPELADAIVRALLAGSPEARVLGAGVIVRFPYLAPDVEVEPLLKAGLKQSVPEAQLALGELYLGGQRALRDPVAARSALQAATAIPQTAVSAEFYLGRLYQAGYLDEVDPAQARDHLLKAARAGYLAADSALARLYASGKGLCPNRRVAWLFARLGSEGGAEPIRVLLGELQQALSAEDKAAGEALLLQELAARGASASRPPGSHS